MLKVSNVERYYAHRIISHRYVDLFLFSFERKKQQHLFISLKFLFVRSAMTDKSCANIDILLCVLNHGVYRHEDLFFSVLSRKKTI